MKNLILPLLLAIICSASCQSNSDTLEGKNPSQKTQHIDDTFQAVDASKSDDIVARLEKKSKDVKENDTRKTIIAKFEGEGISKNISSLSSANDVEIRNKGNKRQITLVTKSSFKERATRFILEFDKEDKETGSFEINGMSLLLETYKEDGDTYEVTSAQSWVKGTIKLYINDDHQLKGTAKINIPKLTFNKNGQTEKTSKDVTIELGFYNAKL